MSNEKQFINDQLKEIERFLEERKKAGKSVDDNAVMEWVDKGKSEEFREKWDKDHT